MAGLFTFCLSFVFVFLRCVDVCGLHISDAYPNLSVRESLFNVQFCRYYIVGAQQFDILSKHTCSVLHAQLHVNSSLYTAHRTLLWSRPANSLLFKPCTSRSVNVIFCSILLLTAGDVESNPGPQQRSTSIRFGYINICSAVKKAALIHDLIAGHSLDLLALSETRFNHTTPNAICNDIAPDGFCVTHTYRLPTALHPAGGGLAIIHRKELIIKQHPLSGTISPTSFELQLVRITSTKPPITIVNAYRPPSLSVTAFHDELSDVLARISPSTADRLLVCGDLNCPGSDAVSTSSELADVFDVLGLKQHVTSPTRSNPEHLLDVLATDPSLAVREVRVDEAGQISDHRLVVATITVDSLQYNAPVVFTFRRIKNIDTKSFEQKLRESSLFKSPASTADKFAEQMKNIIVATLDDVAPVRRLVRRPPKAITKFLSEDAIEAKRTRRRLERRWLKSHEESDRVAYRRACRRANKLINVSRQNYFREQLSSGATVKDRWRISKQLLHSTETDSTDTVVGHIWRLGREGGGRGSLRQI